MTRIKPTTRVRPSRDDRSSTRPRRAAAGTALVFALSGAVQTSWMSRLPAVRDRLHIGLADLGLALLAMGAGCVLAMPLTGRACQRFGSRRMVYLGTSVSCVALVGLGRVATPGALAAVLFCFGFAYGTWDAAMNVQAAAVEAARGRPWMSMFHGYWSFGSVAGAGSGALAAHANLPLPVHLLVIALLGAPLCTVGAALFLDERGGAVPDSRLGSGGMRRRLLLIAVVTLCGATIEAAAGDWLAIYLTRARSVSQAGAAGGYTLFVSAMVAGRFAATPVTTRLGRATTVRAGALLAALGVVVTVLAPGASAYPGVVCWGCGICVVFPAALSASAEAPRASEAVAWITTVGYGAGMVGPPVIGRLGQQVGLGPALLALPVLANVVVALAGSLGRGTPARPRAPGEARECSGAAAGRGEAGRSDSGARTG